MTIPPYQPGRPTWQAGYEHARRQAFALAVTAGDPAHRIAQMRPTPPVRDVDLDEMRERFARQGMAPTPYSAPTTLHARVAAHDSASGGNALCGDLRGNEGVVG